MAQQIQAPAAKPDILSSIPGTPMVGGNWFLQLVLWPPHMCFGTHVETCKYIYAHQIENLNVID